MIENVYFLSYVHNKACTLGFRISITLLFSLVAFSLALKCVLTGAVISLMAQNVTFHGHTA